MSKTQEMREIKHPPFVIRDRDADAYVFDYVVGGKKMKRYALSGKLCQQMSTILRKTRSAFNSLS
jgi:hypothetical protein